MKSRSSQGLVLIAFLASIQSGMGFAAQPGEAVMLDPATGNYVVTYCDPRSFAASGDCVLEQVVFVPATKILPTVRSTLSFHDTKISFEYRLRNAKRSPQPIAVFVLDAVSSLAGGVPVSTLTAPIDEATLVAAMTSWSSALRSPSGWQALAVPNKDGTAIRAAWVIAASPNAAPDGLTGLAPDQHAGGFGLLSDDLPGLSLAQLSGNPGRPPVFPDDGPTGDIGLQLEALETSNYVSMLVAVPAIQVPNPMDRAELLRRIRSQAQMWISLKAVDPIFFQQLDRWLQAAIDAATHSSRDACNSDLKKIVEMIKDIVADDNSDDQKTSESSSRKSTIVPLAARTLNFDLTYVIRSRQE
jgi:hypothetical protein